MSELIKGLENMLKIMKSKDEDINKIYVNERTLSHIASINKVNNSKCNAYAYESTFTGIPIFKNNSLDLYEFEIEYKIK